MKKILLALAAVSLIASAADAQNTLPWRYRTVQVPWNFVRASTYSGQYIVHNDDNGAIVDSSGVGIVIGAAPILTDTTAWFQLDDMVWAYAGVAPTTAFSPIRLTLTGTNTSEDSVSITTQVKFDNAIAPFAVTTPANLLTTGSTTYDNILTASCATDADAALAVTQVPYGARQIRFLLSGTGTAAGAGVMTGCKLYITYPSSR